MCSARRDHKNLRLINRDNISSYCNVQASLALPHAIITAVSRVYGEFASETKADRIH